MCGIAGIVNFKGDRPLETGQLELMGASLAHRGPDDFETYLDSRTGRCGFAHARLAIIDPDQGRQPLANEDKSLWITYNGECYNFLRLRDDLEEKGHQFRTRCDSEVVLHLYEEYGPDCVDHIRGMFAFAVWDSKQERLFLARDRMGQKPLFYAVNQDRFIFASECKAILQIEDFPRQVDAEALTPYLLLGYVPYPRSAFKDIKQLPPAHIMTIDATNYHSPAGRGYWSLPTEPSFDGSFAQAAEQLRAELDEAVRLRMISDVPLGAFLSGGIDSTIIVGLMSGNSDNPVKTCSIGFGEELYNELPFALQVAEHFECDHYEQIVKPECRDAIEKLSYYYDEPFADSSALPTFYLSRAARSRVKVALTGDGGDEGFGGYDRYKAMYLAERFNRWHLLRWLGRRGFWHRLRADEHHRLRHKLKRFFTAAALDPAQRYLKWVAVFDPDMLQHLTSDNLVKIGAGVIDWNYLARFFSGGATFGPEAARLMGQAMLADGSLYLPGDLNTKIDRASMAVGLELRCPFQDHKVLELAYSLPTPWRHNGFLSKVILRRACRDLIPENINRRPKLGFGVPVGRWFRGELREMFLDIVMSPQALQRGYFKRAALERLLAENDQRQADHGHRLWSLLMLELWHRRYIDDKPALKNCNRSGLFRPEAGVME